MAWTTGKPAVGDETNSSITQIAGNFSQLESEGNVEHVGVNASPGTRGTHRFPRGNASSGAAVPVEGALRIRNDDADLPQYNEIYDGTAWEVSGLGITDQTVPGAKTWKGAAVFESTVLLNADPTDDLQAATKQYADGAGQIEVTVATDAIFASWPPSGSEVVDGDTINDDGVLVLIKDETTDTRNGVYSSSSSGVWPRWTGMPAAGTVTPGVLVAVGRGTENANTLWQLDHDGTNDAITIDTHAITFTENKGALTQITQAFTSSDQTITAAGQLVLAHGLGVEPVIVQAFLKNVTDEQGYTTGDMVPIHYSNRDATFTGMSLIVDATNVTVRFSSSASSFDLVNATTGGLVAATNANWNLVIKAIA